MLHVLVGGLCNNNCLFCMEADREGRAAHASRQSDADIRAMIEAFPDNEGILFTSGEPTFNDNLFTYIRLAEQRGFREIGLITNGRRLAYPDYAKGLIDSGINHVTVSIHGHTAKLHDALTRTPGSFEQTCAGLRNLCLLKVSRQFELRTSTVVTSRNLPHLQAIHHFLASNSPIDLMVMNVMMARGRGALYLESLMARYREVVGGVNRLCATLPPEELVRLRVEDIPACVASQLNRAVQGDIEQYRQYEAVGSTGLSEVEISDRDLLEELRRRKSTPELSSDSSYYITDRVLKDGLLRTKGADCPRCSHRASCPGVWQPYARRFGWEEFEPI